MALDLKGKRFGRLMVVARIPRKPDDRNAMWRCLCDCGGETISAAANIGKTTFSCGCLAKETAAELLRGNSYTSTHNMSKTPEHSTWCRIKDRCYNKDHPKYGRYGGRGITVCKRWLESFDNFYKDMGPKPAQFYSIDRINNNGPYSPENCRWATPREQSRNRSYNHFVEINGERRTVSDWMDSNGLPKWKPYELTRKRYKAAAQFKTVDDAVRFLISQNR